MMPEDVAICLSPFEWNQVVGVLGEGPYRIVRPLIDKIVAQAASQQQPPPAAGNGEVATHVAN